MILDLTSGKERVSLLFTLMLLLFANSALAKERTLTLAVAVEKTMTEHPAFRLYEFRLDELEGEEVQSRLRPAINLHAELENFAGTSPFQSFGRSDATVALSSVLERGGKRQARIERSSRAYTLLELNKQTYTHKLLAEVNRRYVDVLASQARATLAGRSKTLADDALAVAVNRVAAGASPDAEVSRARAVASQSHLALRSEQKQLEYLKSALASMWQAPYADFDVVSGDLFEMPTPLSFDDLLVGLEQSSIVLALIAEEQVLDAEVQLAEAQSEVDLGWSLGVRRIGEADETAFVAGVSMPILSGRRIKGIVQTAIASKNVATSNRSLVLLSLRTKLHAAYSQRERAIHEVSDLQRDIVPALEEALRSTRAGYQNGRYGYLDYFSARRELLQARLGLIDTAASVLRFSADIDALTSNSLVEPTLTMGGAE